MTPQSSTTTDQDATPTIDHARLIRVMHVVALFGLAGMERGVINVINRLDPSRFSPMICSLTWQSDETRGLLPARIPVFELRKRRGFDWRLIWRLARLFRRESVDVVHSHNWATFLYTVLAARLARVPVIIHGEHGLEEQRTRPLRAALQRWLAGSVTQFTAVSTDLARALVRDWKLPQGRVTTIPNGVNLDDFGQRHDIDRLREAASFPREARIILNIGGIRPIKDHATLIRAFARVSAALPVSRLLLVGSDYGNGMKPALERLIDSLGLRGAVIFAGVRHDIPQLLALSHVYANTSLFEGMSNTILEAMAAGKPVVATAVGGNPELVQDGTTGFLVAPGDHEQLGERLTALLAEPALCARFGETGRRRAEQHHSLSSMVRRYADLYQETIVRRGLRACVSPKEDVKRLAAYAIRRSGLSRLTERLRPRGLSILTYHRVLPLHDAQRYPFHAMVMPKDLFEAQIAHLARHYHPLGLPEAVRLLQAGRLPKRAVAVTFDDGYLDNYDHAWPILQEFNVPATFFVVTGALDGTTGLWWDDVANAVRALRCHPSGLGALQATLPEWARPVLQRLDRGNAPEPVAEALVKTMNGVSSEERGRLTATLLQAAGSPEHSRLMLTWAEVEEMHRAGATIGAHTVTHAFLDELDDEAARREIDGSLHSLQRRLGGTIDQFCYPRGRVMERAKRWLEKAGVTAAVTTQCGINRPGADLLQLSRIDAGYARLNHGFDPNIFECELEGWLSGVRAWGRAAESDEPAGSTRTATQGTS